MPQILRSEGKGEKSLFGPNSEELRENKEEKGDEEEGEERSRRRRRRGERKNSNRLRASEFNQ